MYMNYAADDLRAHGQITESAVLIPAGNRASLWRRRDRQRRFNWH